MLHELQNELDNGIKSLAENSLLKKLNKQGISKSDLTQDKFGELLDLEIEIIKSDGKKVGSGIAVGIGISLLSGGLL